MANSAINTTTAASTLRTYFKRKTEKLIVYKLIGLQACVPDEIEVGNNNVGRFFKVRQVDPLSDTSALTSQSINDNNGSVDQALNIDYVERTVPFFGAHISLNETIKNQSVVNIMDAVSQSIAKQAGETINRRVYFELYLHSSAIRADQDGAFGANNVTVTVTGVTGLTYVAGTGAGQLPNGGTASRYNGAHICFKNGEWSGLAVTVDAAGHNSGASSLAWTSDNVLPGTGAGTTLADIWTPSGMLIATAGDALNINAVLGGVERIRDLGGEPGVIGKQNMFFFGQIGNASEYDLLTGSGAGSYQDLYKYTDVTDVKYGKAGQLFGTQFVKEGKPARFASADGVRSDTGLMTSNFLVGDQAVKGMKMWSGRRLDGVTIEISRPGPSSTNDVHKQTSIVAWNARFVAACVEARHVVNVMSPFTPVS